MVGGRATASAFFPCRSVARVSVGNLAAWFILAACLIGALARAVYAANRTEANFMRAELASRRDESHLAENLFDLANLAIDEAARITLQREAVAKTKYVIDDRASDIHPNVAVEALRDFRLRESSIEAFAPRIPIEARTEVVRACTQIGGLRGAEALVACARAFVVVSLDLFTNDAVTTAIVAGFADWRAQSATVSTCGRCAAFQRRSSQRICHSDLDDNDIQRRRSVGLLVDAARRRDIRSPRPGRRVAPCRKRVLQRATVSVARGACARIVHSNDRLAAV